MNAVFLDRNTFSPQLALPAPSGIRDWQVYQETAADEALIVQRLRDADIAITNKVVLNEAILSACPRLKLVHITATGMNNVDLEACKRLGIAVFNVAGYSTESVVEHSFMMILNALRGFKHYQNTAFDGSWQAAKRFCLVDLPLLDLHGKTLAIMGTGAIGQGMKKIAEAFGCRVLLSERRGQKPRSSAYTAFESALGEADIISLHCPLTPETHHLINEETLTLCRPEALIVNAARGPVVDSQAIVKALNAGKLWGYATDVTPVEPPAADEALLQLAAHPRVIITPHQAWASEAAQKKLWHILSQQISDFIQKT